MDTNKNEFEEQDIYAFNASIFSGKREVNSINSIDELFRGNNFVLEEINEQNVIVETISNNVAVKLEDSIGKDIRDIKEFVHNIKEQSAAANYDMASIKRDTKEINNTMNAVKLVTERTDNKIEVLKNNSVEVVEKLEQLRLENEKSEWNLGKIQGYAEKSGDTIIQNGERLIEIDGRISNVEERIAALKDELEKRSEATRKRNRGFLGKAKSLLNILGLASSV